MKVYQSETGDSTTRYTYTYDANGNITKSTNQDGLVTRYTYDTLGQLTREDNPYLNKTYVYTYDNAGNRLSKKKYAYTTGTPGNATATESYNYTGDRLTQVGSTVYQYDAIGNPTTYNGYTLEWNGRKLMEMSMNGGQFLYTFAYNADGIRTVKTNGSTIHHYTLNGSQIVTDDLPMVDALPGNVTATDAATIGISIGATVAKEEYDPNPYKRPGQKKQGRENRNGSRKKPDWEPRNNKRSKTPAEPKKHTPGKDHRKYFKSIGYEKIEIYEVK